MSIPKYRKQFMRKLDKISRPQVHRMIDRIYENKDMPALDSIKGVILLCYERPRPGLTREAFQKSVDAKFKAIREKSKIQD